jgi:hypothetical protein
MKWCWIQLRIRRLSLKVVYGTFYATLYLIFLAALDNWLYSRDITRRRVKYDIKTAFIGIGILVLAFLVLAALDGLQPQALQFLSLLTKGWIDLLESFALSFGLNGPELATIVSADLIVVIMTGILNFLIWKRIVSSDSQSQHANLRIFFGSRADTTDGAKYTLRVSNADGEDAATECRAVAIFRDIEARDIVDHPKANATYDRTNFKSELRIQLPWVDIRPTWTLLSGDEGYDAPLQVMRVVQAKDSVPAHFEILCTSTFRGVPSSGTAVCLNLKHYYGKIKIHPQRGKFKEFPFTIKPNSNKEWFFECGTRD